MKKFVSGSGRSLLQVHDTNCEFFLYLPKAGSPANIAAVMAAVRTAKVAGEVMADIAGLINPQVRGQLVAPKDVCKYKRQETTDLYYRLCVDKYGSYEIQVDAIGPDGREQQLFNGTLREFMEWASRQTGLEGLAKKVVRFKYNNGSTTGATRTVRVEKITSNEKHLFVEGIDLECDSLHQDAYRKFSTEHILGEITVVN